MKVKQRIRQLHMELAEKRGLHSTYCPSEVARKIDPDNWRALMGVVRAIADELIKEDKLIVMQKGEVIAENATNAFGPIRLRKKD